MSKVTQASDFGRVALLMGGTSSEREVSLASGAAVLEGLRSRGVDVTVVDGIPALIEALVARRFDRVFNILHGNKGGGEDGVLQGVLEAFSIPVTGSGVLGSALAMDKIRTKQIWQSLALPTPRYLRLQQGDDIIAAARSLGLPVIIKPSCEGSSVGISRVSREGDLQQAVELAARYPGEMLMEELIQGSEFSVPLLGEQVLPSIRVVPAGEYYDYHAKYVADDTTYVCPGLDGEAERDMQQLVLTAFKAIGCSGWGRVDVMRDNHGRNYLLEVNTAPGMTSHSLVPKSARQVGIEFDELVWRILEDTLSVKR
jgi:D-alanine-D-alanine ligase